MELVQFKDCGPAVSVETTLNIMVYDAEYVALAATTDTTVNTAEETLLKAAVDTGYEDRIAHVRELPDG